MQSIFFCKIFICVEKLTSIKYYREFRWEIRVVDELIPILYNLPQNRNIWQKRTSETKHYIYSKRTDLEGSVNIYHIYQHVLTLPWRRSLSYKNQSIDLLYKAMDCFLCDRDPRHERVRTEFKSVFIEIFFAEKKPPYFLPTFSKYVFSKIFHSLLYSF